LKNIYVGSRKVGGGSPAFIVAETAWAHDGSKANAKRIIEGAAEAEADAVNIHITSLEDYMVPSYTGGVGKSSSTTASKPLYEYLKSINLSFEDWAELTDLAKSHGLKLSVLCNDLKSLEFSSTLNPDLYTIHLSCLGEEELVKKAASKGRPVMLNIGGARLGEVEKALGWVQEGGAGVAVMYGVQTYPTKIEDARVGYVGILKNLFRVPVGYADHTDADNELTYVIPVLAVALGADIVEKHITYNRGAKGEDYESSLEPEEFKRFVKLIRSVEISLGEEFYKGSSDAELLYRKVSFKRLVAAKDIEKGEILTRDRVVAKRSDEGLAVWDVDTVVGRRAAKKILKDEGITLNKLT